MSTLMPPVMQGGTSYSTNPQDIIEGLLSNPVPQDSTRYNANAFNPMYMVTANSTSPTGYSKFLKPVNADGSPYNPVAQTLMPTMPPSTISDRPFVPSDLPAIPSIPFRDIAFGDYTKIDIAPSPEAVAATSPRNPNTNFNKVTSTFDPYNGIQVDQSGKIVNAVQLGLGSDYQGSPQDVMNYLADRERQRAIAEDKAMYEINSRLVPAIDNRGGSTQPVAPSYPPNMLAPVPQMPNVPEPRLNFGYAAPTQMPTMPRDMMFNQQSMANVRQPMPVALPSIMPNLPAQITPMAMQNQAPMENLQPTSSRFDPAILQKLISSVPVRRRRKK